MSAFGCLRAPSAAFERLRLPLTAAAATHLAQLTAGSPPISPDLAQLTTWGVFDGTCTAEAEIAATLKTLLATDASIALSRTLASRPRNSHEDSPPGSPLATRLGAEGAAPTTAPTTARRPFGLLLIASDSF